MPNYARANAAKKVLSGGDRVHLGGWLNTEPFNMYAMVPEGNELKMSQKRVTYSR